MVVLPVNQGHARTVSPEITTKIQASKARPKDQHPHVILFTGKYRIHNKTMSHTGNTGNFFVAADGPITSHSGKIISLAGK